MRAAHARINLLSVSNPLPLQCQTNSPQGIIRLFDLVEPEAAPAIIASQKGLQITRIVWSRQDPQRVLAGGNDGKIRAWDLRTQQEVQSAQVDGAWLVG